MGEPETTWKVFAVMVGPLLREAWGGMIGAHPEHQFKALKACTIIAGSTEDAFAAARVGVPYLNPLARAEQIRRQNRAYIDRSAEIIRQVPALRERLSEDPRKASVILESFCSRYATCWADAVSFGDKLREALEALEAGGTR